MQLYRVCVYHVEDEQGHHSFKLINDFSRENFYGGDRQFQERLLRDFRTCELLGEVPMLMYDTLMTTYEPAMRRVHQRMASVRARFPRVSDEPQPWTPGITPGVDLSPEKTVELRKNDPLGASGRQEKTRTQREGIDELGGDFLGQFRCEYVACGNLARFVVRAAIRDIAMHCCFHHAMAVEELPPKLRNRIIRTSKTRSLEINHVGPAAELAFSKVTGLDVNLLDHNPFRACGPGDVDIRIRTTLAGEHNLLICPEDEDNAILVLAKVALRQVWFLGWIPAAGGKRPQWWCPSDAAYHVPSEELNDLESLRIPIGRS